MFCGLILDGNVYKAYFNGWKIKRGRLLVVISGVVTTGFGNKLCEGPFVGVEEKVQVSHQF
jgi:hypothetical protein